MSEQKQPKRRGRPPRNPDAPTGRSSHHLGLRIDDRRWEALGRLVEAANERSRAAGVPAVVTASSLVAMWIARAIDEETSKLGRGRK